MTQDEFRAYYTNISACIDDDDYFELMMRNAWHISGGEAGGVLRTGTRPTMNRRASSARLYERSR